jgi:hypothetical protein
MNTQHGHGHAAWIWACNTDMDLQHGQGISMVLDMQHGHGHAAWARKCSIHIKMQHWQVNAACPSSCKITMNVLMQNFFYNHQLKKHYMTRRFNTLNYVCHLTEHPQLAMISWMLFVGYRMLITLFPPPRLKNGSSTSKLTNLGSNIYNFSRGSNLLFFSDYCVQQALICWASS